MPGNIVLNVRFSAKKTYSLSGPIDHLSKFTWEYVCGCWEVREEKCLELRNHHIIHVAASIFWVIMCRHCHKSSTFIIATLYHRCYYFHPHFTDEETEKSWEYRTVCFLCGCIYITVLNLRRGGTELLSHPWIHESTDILGRSTSRDEARRYFV